MGITVREAMQIGGLVSCKVVAGADGLDKIIDSITVMEVPDVIRWLKTNVLLLTSLYPIKDDEEAIRQLVQRLHTAGSSALAIKTEQYVKQIPEAIIEAGNRLGLPIIEIRNEVSYLDIMTPLMELILRKEDPGKDQLESFFQWITELAMGGKGITALIEALEQMTGNMITVGSDDAALELCKGMAIAPLTKAQMNELIAVKRPIRMQRMLDRQLTPCIVAPLLLNEELVGEVTCWQSNREFLERDFRVLERAMALIALEFLKVITKADVEQTFKDHLLADVLLGRVQDKTETLEKGRRFGWDLTENYQVYSIAVANRSTERECKDSEAAVWSPETKRKLLLKVQSFFRFGASKVIVTFLKQNLIVLHPYQYAPPKEAVLQQADSIHQQLSDEFEQLSFTVGIGRWYPGLDGVHMGYTESCKAIQLGRPLRTSGVIHYEDLGIFRILSQCRDRNELEILYSETIGKLVEYDEIHNASLEDTLTHYFANHCSLSETAEKLFVHVNTMKYRLQKIEQVTGFSVSDAEDRLLLHVGLKIRQLLQTETV